jgi:hypothetical protein
MSERREKFTPAPWFFSFIREEPTGFYSDLLMADDGEPIMAVKVPTREFVFWKLGDMRRVAAAPDLYDALDAMYEATPDNDGDTPLGRACVKARAALAKARGEAS